MPGAQRPLRVLQLIGDTDAVPAQLPAVALHRGLTSLGVEVRTLALAPGRRGGLEQDVPSIAPSRRSFAARGLVVTESRWADVVVLHAPGALTPATLPSRRSGSPPLVVAVWFDDGRPPAGWSAAARLVAAATTVVTPPEHVAELVRSRSGRADGVAVVPADLNDEGRPLVDVAGWSRILNDALG